MRFNSGEWKAWLVRSVDDFRSPAYISVLTWMSLLICVAVFVVWLMR
jgi:hypothetical protein